MRVDIGNQNAIEGFRTDDSTELQFRRLDGQRVTSFFFPPGLSPREASEDVIGTLSSHMEPGSFPAWIDSDDKALKTMLCAHFEIDKQTARPASWGQPLGAPEKVIKNKTKKTTHPKAAAQDEEAATPVAEEG